MLSPASNDKNRKAENKRKKENPADFGNYGGNEKPKDFKPVGLKKASTDKSNDVEEDKDDTLTNEERTALLVEAIGELEEGNEEHFTGDGLPRVEVLEALAGIVDISADERNAAFEAFNEAK